MSEDPATAPAPERGAGPRPSGGDAREKDPFYILAPSPLADERTRVLKHGDTFAVMDHYGDFKPGGLGEEGLYHEGTRYLSRLLLGLNRDRPLFLSSTVREDNDLLAVDLTNPDVSQAGRVVIPRGTLHVARTKFLREGVCYERVRVRNYGLMPVEASLVLFFEADFVDIFEVRGARRKKRGQPLGGTVEDAGVVLAYRGLDEVVRRTRLSFAPRPAALSGAEARFHLTLPPQGEQTIDLTVSCEQGQSAPALADYGHALAAADRALDRAQAGACTIHTTNEQFNAWVNRAVADLFMLTTQTAAGPYPYAGIPWFSTPFGRDGILTALECLWLDPGLARGVLAYLAATQATAVNPEQDAEPGKILHETRRGEMAALGEIPFGGYYGSVDATPLFVLLAGAYFERTADRAFVASIWPNVEAALRWTETYGDADGDGFVEYFRRSRTGLGNQGWKDSEDAIFHADGTLARGPIALCEVQGYVYAARLAGAELAAALGHAERAEELRRQAGALRERFEQAFWCEELSTYALALDGDKRPCRVRTSNPGHCLLTGIAGPERARRTAQTLLNPDSFSGWGVRTVAAGEARFNPMAYHNGSVWPHDNALIAQGLARYGLTGETLGILDGQFGASLFMDLHRLPELFCGFTRRPGEGPTHYPVACAPQAWSAAAVFLLLQACLGLSVRAGEARVCFSYPVLPAFLREVEIRNLRVEGASVDLRLVRHAHDVGINVLRREGKVEVTMVK
jgi:glycogen debranching enzyme